MATGTAEGPQRLCAVQRRGTAHLHSLGMGHGHRYFFLDEPTANLDFAATQQLKEILLALKTQGKTLLLSEHRLCDVQPYSIQKGVFHHVHCAGPRFGDSFYHFCHVFRCVNGMAVMLRRGWRRSSGASAQGFPTASVSLPRRQASRPKQQEPAS